MFKTKRLNKIYFILLASLLAIIFISLIVLDYKISNSFSPITNWFTIWFNDYGKLITSLPGFIVVLNFINILFWRYNKIERKRKLFTFLIGLVLLLIIAIYGTSGFYVGGNFIFASTWKNWIYFANYFLILASGFIYMNIIVFYKKIRNDYWVYWLNLNSTYIFGYTILLVISVFLLKVIMGRPRPIEVFRTSDPYTNFKYAFVPNFSRNRGNSFPSGHTQSAGALLGLIFLIPKNNKKNKSFFWLFGSISWLLILATAISRVLIYAHWPTDVMFSIILIILYYYTAPKIIDSIYRMIDQSKQTRTRGIH